MVICYVHVLVTHSCVYLLCTNIGNSFIRLFAIYIFWNVFMQLRNMYSLERPSCGFRNALVSECLHISFNCLDLPL
jgi:hypothetical protein